MAVCGVTTSFSDTADWQQPIECAGALSDDAALLTEQVAWTPVLLAAARRQPRCLQTLLRSLGESTTSLTLRERSLEGKSALHLSAELGSATQLSIILAHVDCSTGSAALRAGHLAY
jgi:hypothetical protein